MGFKRGRYGRRMYRSKKVYMTDIDHMFSFFNPNLEGQPPGRWSNYHQLTVIQQNVYNNGAGFGWRFQFAGCLLNVPMKIKEAMWKYRFIKVHSVSHFFRPLFKIPTLTQSVHAYAARASFAGGLQNSAPDMIYPNTFAPWVWLLPRQSDAYITNPVGPQSVGSVPIPITLSNFNVPASPAVQLAYPLNGAPGAGNPLNAYEDYIAQLVQYTRRQGFKLIARAGRFAVTYRPKVPKPNKETYGFVGDELFDGNTGTGQQQIYTNWDGRVIGWPLQATRQGVSATIDVQKPATALASGSPWVVGTQNFVPAAVKQRVPTMIQSSRDNLGVMGYVKTLPLNDLGELTQAYEAGTPIPVWIGPQMMLWSAQPTPEIADGTAVTLNPTYGLNSKFYWRWACTTRWRVSLYGRRKNPLQNPILYATPTTGVEMPNNTWWAPVQVFDGITEEPPPEILADVTNITNSVIA